MRAGVEFLAARAALGDHPALVVFAPGAADSCATASACATTAREIADLARQAGVQLWLVGLGSMWWSNTLPTALQLLAREPDVRLAVAPTPMSILAASEVVRGALQGAFSYQEVLFRIDGDVAGTFAPGVNVRGVIEFDDFQNSAFGIWEWLPFRVTVPGAAP